MRPSETGQALLEGVLMLGVLSLFFMGVGLVGRYGDLHLTAEHDLQYQLFDLARYPAQTSQGRSLAAKEKALLAPWRDARGALWLPEQALSGQHQFSVGKWEEGEGLAQRWRKSLTDADMLRVDLTKAVGWTPGLQLGVLTQLPDFSIRRSLYRGTGHAVDEAQASVFLAGSGPLWQDLQRRHATSLSALSARLRGLDAAWSRAAPDQHWLRPVETLVPQDRLLERSP